MQATEHLPSLAEAAPFLEVPADGPYGIRLPETDHLIIVFGQDPRKPAGKFAHPNLLCSQLRVHSFKHYLPNGGKKWTERPGIDLFFAIPADKVLIVPEPEYSYVKIRINGVNLVLNVSGGTGGNGWTDWVGPVASVSVGHKISEMKKVAAVATPLEVLQQRGWSLSFDFGKYDDPQYLSRRFAETLFASKVRAALKPGDIVIAGEGTALPGSEFEVQRFSNSPFSLVAGYYRFHSTQVDWYQTGLKLGLCMPGPDRFKSPGFSPPPAKAMAS